MVAISEACRAGRVPGEVAIVLSDADGAGILTRATERGIRALFIPPGKFRTKLDEAAERAYIAALQQAQVDLIVLAGFMRILKGDFLRAFPERVVNIHPALLPSFGGQGMFGRRVHEAVLSHGCKVSGCTVHFVDDAYDNGPIILQRSCPVLDDDTPETLAARVFEEEKIAYPQAIRLFQEGKLKIDGRRVRIGKPDA